MISLRMPACTDIARFLTRTILMSVVLLLPSFALADSRTDLMIARLRFPPDAGQADDFRVRTSAALGLGATNDDKAVQPLCQALNDPSDVVRQAVAVALKRLGRPAALPCLKGRLSTEDSSDVKLQLTRAISDLSSGGNSGTSSTDSFTPKTIPGAKFYVSISPITNNTGRAQADVDRVILGAMRAKLEATGKHQLAPVGESPDSAKAAIAKHKMKGYYLAISVDKFDYSDGNLRVRIKTAVFSYPGKSLLGEVPSGLTQTGVSPGDKASEDNLMGIAAQRAVDLFTQNFN
jgi:hypothetical protein